MNKKNTKRQRPSTMSARPRNAGKLSGNQAGGKAHDPNIPVTPPRADESPQLNRDAGWQAQVTDPKPVHVPIRLTVMPRGCYRDPDADRVAEFRDELRTLLDSIQYPMNMPLMWEPFIYWLKDHRSKMKYRRRHFRNMMFNAVLLELDYEFNEQAGIMEFEGGARQDIADLRSWIYIVRKYFIGEE